MRTPGYREDVTCPIHNTSMYYHRPSDQYACQNPDCKYAHGIPAENLYKKSLDITDRWYAR